MLAVATSIEDCDLLVGLVTYMYDELLGHDSGKISSNAVNANSFHICH